MKKLQIISILVLFNYSLLSQVSIELNLNSFQINKLSDFIENNEEEVSVSFINNTTSVQEIKLGFHLKKISGVSPIFEIKTEYAMNQNCYEIAASTLEEISGFDLGPLFNEESVEYDGISRAELLVNKELSEGIFELCATVGDCDTQNGIYETSCKTFEVFSANPPQIFGICGQEIELDESILNVNWSFIPSPSFMEDMVYEVRILKVEKGFNPYETFENNENNYFFSEKVTGVTSLDLDLSIIHFENEATYAIQIQAIDETESFIIKNEGKSEVCTFTTGKKELFPQPFLLDICNENITSAVLIDRIYWNIDHEDVYDYNWKGTLKLSKLEEDDFIENVFEDPLRAVHEFPFDVTNYVYDGSRPDYSISLKEISSYIGIENVEEIFKAGDKYAIQLEVSDSDKKLQIENGGKSEVCAFYIDEEHVIPEIINPCNQELTKEELKTKVSWKFDHPQKFNKLWKSAIRIQKYNEDLTLDDQMTVMDPNFYIHYSTMQLIVPESLEDQDEILFSTDLHGDDFEEVFSTLGKYVMRIDMEDPDEIIQLADGGRSANCSFRIKGTSGFPEVIDLCDQEVLKSSLMNKISWKLDHPKAYNQRWVGEVRMVKVGSNELYNYAKLLEGEYEGDVISLRFDQTNYTTNEDQKPDFSISPSARAIEQGLSGFEDNFEKGQTWVVQVTMKDPDGNVVLENGGKSNICKFTIANDDIVPEIIELCDVKLDSGEELDTIKWRFDHPLKFNRYWDCTIYLSAQDPNKTYQQHFDDRESENVIKLESSQLLNVPDDYEGKEKLYFDVNISEISTLDRSKLNGDYLIQILMNDPEGVAGSHFSSICKFNIGGSGFQLHYPIEGEVIPFSFYPVIIRHSPYNKDYALHNFKFTLEDPDLETLDYENDNKWPNGPQISQQNHLNDCGFSETISEKRSGYLAYNRPELFTSRDENELPYYTKGEDLFWTFSGEIKDRHGDILLKTDEPLEGFFRTGMSSSELLLPKDGAKITRDTVSLKLNSAEAPSRMVPDYYIYRALSEESDCYAFNGTVFEGSRIEISTDSLMVEKDSIVFDSVLIFGNYLPSNTDIYHLANLFENGEPDIDKVNALRDSIYREINITDVPIEKGRYFWRAVWLEDPYDEDGEYYESSDIYEFSIIDKPIDNKETEPEACQSDCSEITIIDSDHGKLLEKSEEHIVELGKFEMLITEITEISSSTQTYDGSGLVRVPFLFDAEIEVEFQGLKLNAENQVSKGEIRAKRDQAFDVEIDDYGSMKLSSLKSIKDDALAALSLAKNIHNLVSGEKVSLPLQVSVQNENDTYMAGILDMWWTPTGAYMQVMANLDLPWGGSYGNQALSFGGQDCFGPDGPSKDFILYRVGDLDIIKGNAGETSLTIKGVKEDFNGDFTQLDTSKLTYLEWDCKGFEKLQIAGEVGLPRSSFIPTDEDGKAIADENKQVKAFFRGYYRRGGHFLTNLNFEHSFIHDAWKDMVFEVGEATLDLSDIENPKNLKIPNGYVNSTLTTSGMSNTWQGIYLAQSKLTIKNLLEDSSAPVNGVIQHIIIDHYKLLTVDAQVIDLVKWNEGRTIDDWAISIDTVSLSMVQNSNVKTRMKGHLGVPLFDESSHLKYEAFLDYNNNASWAFKAYTDSTITMPLMANAQIDLDSSSIIQIGNESGRTKVFANFHGYASATGTLKESIDLAGNFLGDKVLKFDSLRFENLGIDGLDIIDSAKVSFASPQKYLAGFPINIKDAGFGIKSGAPNFFIEPQVTLGGGISGSTRLIFQTGLKTITSRSIYDLVDVSLDSIAIEFEWNGFELDGKIGAYDANNSKGFRGGLDVILPFDDIEGIKFNADFGTYGTDSDGQWGSDSFYGYWYVDGMADLPKSLPILPGFELLGIGGGLYSNMAQSSPATFTMDEDSENKKAVYKPSFNSKGAILSTVMATSANNETFNMDAALSIEIQPSGGLGKISFDGVGYAMTEVKDRKDPKLWGALNLTYDHEYTVLDGNLNANLKIKDSAYELVGNMGDNYRLVDAQLKVDNSTWFLHIGNPAKRAGVALKIGGIGGVNADTYFMVGDRIPANIPAPPDKLLELLGSDMTNEKDEGELLDDTKSDVKALVNASFPGASEISSGTGFAHGLSIDGRVDFDDWPLFYLNAGAIFGYDINVSKNFGILCGNTGQMRGINGWYAQGQAYGGFWGDLGIKVDVWFYSGKISLVNLSAALLLEAKSPRPTYLSGKARVKYSVLGGVISGVKSMHLSVGEECIPEHGDPFAGINFIDKIRPQDGLGVSTTIYPEVSFYTEVNKDFEIPTMSSSGRPAIRKIRVVPYSITLNDLEKEESVTGTISVSSDRLSATLKYTSTLIPETKYQASAEVRAYELINGSYETLLKDGKPWSEIKTGEIFTTGKGLEKLTSDNVEQSYPIDRQNYFLIEDAISTGGFIEFDRDYRDAFKVDEHIGVNKYSYEYYLRFSVLPLENGNFIEQKLELQSNNSIIKFDVSQLEKDKLYAAQIIRRTVGKVFDPGNLTVDQDAMGGHSFGNSLSSNTTNNHDYAVENITKTIDFGENEYLDINLKSKKLPSETIGDSLDFVVYGFHFGTSMYGRFQDKLGNLGMRSIANVYGGNDISTDGEMFDEGFDELELNKLLTFTIPKDKNSEVSYDPYLDKMNPLFYNLGDEVKEYFSRNDIILPRNTHLQISDKSLMASIVYASLKKIKLSDEEIQGGFRNSLRLDELKLFEFKSLGTYYDMERAIPSLTQLMYSQYSTSTLGFKISRLYIDKLPIELKTKVRNVLSRNVDLKQPLGYYNIIASYRIPFPDIRGTNQKIYKSVFTYQL